ncbi:hypothetical protein [Streptomyces roseoverticillatus]|uniref:Uncharacterized protein n=1 Tax=Streptomyces roseoverticillatus TaxID=66429 RepID=A0ABV3ITM8_9ACTN
MSRAPRAPALYPRAYRRTHGDEIAAHYAESTAGASFAERRREEADLAAHALRMRLRLTSGDPLGRALAVAAPYAATGAAVDDDGYAPAGEELPNGVEEGAVGAFALAGAVRDGPRPGGERSGRVDGATSCREPPHCGRTRAVIAPP